MASTVPWRIPFRFLLKCVTNTAVCAGVLFWPICFIRAFLWLFSKNDFVMFWCEFVWFYWHALEYHIFVHREETFKCQLGTGWLTAFESLLRVFWVHPSLFLLLLLQCNDLCLLKSSNELFQFWLFFFNVRGQVREIEMRTSVILTIIKLPDGWCDVKAWTEVHQVWVENTFCYASVAYLDACLSLYLYSASVCTTGLVISPYQTNLGSCHYLDISLICFISLHLCLPSYYGQISHTYTAPFLLTPLHC